MIPTPLAKRSITRKTSLVLAAALACGTSMAAPPRPADGLAGLDDRAVQTELSSRGITNFLDYYFKTNNVPEAQQRSIKTYGAFSELNNANSKIPYSEKARRVREVAEGIDALLPTLKEPAQMMATAATMIDNGVTRNVNNIEYWGEDPVTQAQLKPVTGAVLKLMDAAAAAAQVKADELGKTLKGANDPNAPKWEEMDNLAHTAAYSRNMTVYFDCLATPAKDPSRRKNAVAAITALTDFDTPDSGVQARVRNMIAKLSMTAGDFKTASKTFHSVYDEKNDTKPDPNPFEQYESAIFHRGRRHPEQGLNAGKIRQSAAGRLAEGRDAKTAGGNQWHVPGGHRRRRQGH